jgi:tyrosinase
MNYDRDAADPINSPMFDGSPKACGGEPCRTVQADAFSGNASSMGGNGGPSNYPGVPQPYRKPHD